MNELILELFQAVSDKPELDEAGRQRVFSWLSALLSIPTGCCPGRESGTPSGGCAPQCPRSSRPPPGTGHTAARRRPCGGRAGSFHPMVSAENVQYWKENFDWWDQQCREYGYDAFRDVMMLEVRNDGWTEENIRQYTAFLDPVRLSSLPRRVIPSERAPSMEPENCRRHPASP